MKKLYNNNLSSIKNIVNVFLKTIPEQIKEIQNLCEEENWKNFSSKVGNLRSKLKYFKLKTLGEKLTIIENNVKTKTNRSETQDLINEINDLWVVAEKELRVISKL